jgi:hypothetical protein
MSIDAIPINSARAREVYDLLQELDRHISAQDASGRGLLYQAKERIRLLMISIDRSNVTYTSRVPANDG